MVSKSELEMLQARYPDFPWARSDCDYSNAKQEAKQERPTGSERDQWRRKLIPLVGLVGEFARRASAHAKQ
jgi:hypothetical protein